MQIARRLALGAMALAGAGGGLGDVAATTLLQAQSDDEVRSRVFAAQDGAAHVAYTLAAFVAGVVVALAGVRDAFAAAAICSAGAMLLALRLSTEIKSVEKPVENG